MRDPDDTQTAELLPPAMTKAQRFRAKQIANGMRQYAYWLTPDEAKKVQASIKRMRKT
jgi:hypothetical protein